MKLIKYSKLAVTLAALTLVSVAWAGPKMNFNASQTFVFDPDNTGGGYANWVKDIGLADRSGNKNYGLRLEKNVAIEVVVASGAALNGLKNVVVQAGDTLGYDMSNDSTATTTGSGPRFNVSWTMNGTSGFSFVGGSANATKTPACQSPATWTRYRLSLQDPAQAFPIVPVGAKLQSVTLILDEPGQNTLDNINFRDQIATKPGDSDTTSGCP